MTAMPVTERMTVEEFLAIAPTAERSWAQLVGGAWYSADRVPSQDATAPYAMPSIAVEVRSPSTWRHDVAAKKSGCEQAGLPELWLVDRAADEILVVRRSTPAATAFDAALELTRDETLTSPLLPGFALSLAAVFGE